MKKTIHSKVRPMKPVTENCNIADLKFPVGVTRKLDGIRCLVTAEGAMSASGKPIPNHHIRRWIELHLPIGFDGEIMLRNPKATFQDITSAVMSHWGVPDFKFWVFDNFALALIYSDRMKWIANWKHLKFLTGSKLLGKRYDFLLPTICNNAEEVESHLQKCLDNGDEGIIIRSLDAPYKFGRSTLSEGGMLRYKPFIHGEAKIIGFYEQETNCNIAGTSELGFTKRSTAKAGRVGKDTLGGFRVCDVESKQKFHIGTGQGLTEKARQYIWDNPNEFNGKIIRYKKQLAGEKDKPRTPIFTGFRDERDMTKY